MGQEGSKGKGPSGAHTSGVGSSAGGLANVQNNNNLVSPAV